MCKVCNLIHEQILNFSVSKAFKLAPKSKQSYIYSTYQHIYEDAAGDFLCGRIKFIHAKLQLSAEIVKLYKIFCFWVTGTSFPSRESSDSSSLNISSSFPSLSLLCRRPNSVVNSIIMCLRVLLCFAECEIKTACTNKLHSDTSLCKWVTALLLLLLNVREWNFIVWNIEWQNTLSSRK